MTLGKMLLKILFWPGNMVLSKLGVTIEQDGGILRMFINASVWGLLCLLIAVKFFV